MTFIAGTGKLLAVHQEKTTTWAPLISVLTVIGTTEPFSAISGVLVWVWSLPLRVELPYSTSTAASTVAASKAAFGQVAGTMRGVGRSVLIASFAAPVAVVHRMAVQTIAFLHYAHGGLCHTGPGGASTIIHGI